MKVLVTFLFCVLCIQLFASNKNSERACSSNDISIIDSMKLKIAIGAKTFTATLYNNETVTAFKAKLPMTINMTELNGNEKYFDLPDNLPTNASNPGTIQSGDLMLYGSNTLVLFYKSFSTSYNYTRVARIENPSGLATALGTGNKTVKFEIEYKSYLINNQKNIMKHIAVITVLSILMFGQAYSQTKQKKETMKNTEQKEQYTFKISDKVTRQAVTFKNRYGITISGDLYIPKNRGTERLAALVISGPFGAVKEQSSGLYANELAARGFATLAFDPSFTGESGGEVRNVASPDIFTEDFSAAVDYIGLLSSVDRNRIGVVGICGLSGMALTAATSDTRIKAVATASMYDMSRSISRSYKDSYTPEQRKKVIDYLSQQRWADAEKGNYGLGLHEVPFDEKDNLVKGNKVLPDALPENPNPVLASFYNYYKTPRGFHPRSINSTTAWTATTPMAFFNFPMMANLELISPRPIMLIAGENAHSRYYSEDVFKMASEPKDLVIVPKAYHVDLYDKTDLIPFDKLEAFFKQHLK
jgi:fermentation-respiration switch protein FrsA (DUF1100 family)